MRGGSVCAHPRQVSRCSGIVSGSSGGGGSWARPSVCGNWNRKGSSAASGDGLATQVVEVMWPRPDASGANSGESPESWERRREQQRGRGVNGNGMGEPLGMAVQREETPWPRLTASDGDKASSAFGRGNPTHNGAVRADTPWPRLTVSDGLGGRCPEESLPRRPDGSVRSPSQKEILGGTLNPAWEEALMGWPIGLVSGLPWREYKSEAAAELSIIGSLRAWSGVSPDEQTRSGSSATPGTSPKP